MAGIDKNMFSPLGIFFLIIFEVVSIVSLIGNGFIIVVIGCNWLRSRKLLPCDFLLIALSLSRFIFQWVSVINQLLYFSFLETYIHSEEQQISVVFWIYLNMASLWCATWLNVFYCVKVINFAHPLFAWLKLKIGMLVPRFFGTSLLAFVICSIHPAIRYFEKEKWCNLTENRPENTSQCGDEAHFGVPVFQFTFTAISFSICVSASVFLLSSLWRHMKNLKKSGLSMKDVGTQAHLNVMKPLVLLLFFYILHFAAMLFALNNILRDGKLEQLISETVLLLYPAAHSIILIFTNPKLNKAYIHAIHFGRSASRK